jgi:hypothetical protein
MPRTVISIDADDKAWLDRKAAQAGVSMTEIVRQAIRRMRQDEESFESLLNQTRGKWRHGDGLAYQRRMRRQWR